MMYSVCDSYTMPNYGSRPTFRGKNYEKVAQKAKETCIAAVKEARPYEKSLLINNKTDEIVSQGIGDLYRAPVHIPFSLLKRNQYTLIHGHTTMTQKNGKKFTLPLSFSDFELFNRNKELKKIVAVDSTGFETSLEKGDNFKKLDKKQMATVQSEFLKSLYEGLCTPEEKHKIQDLYTYASSHPGSTTIENNIINTILEKQMCKEAKDVICSFFERISNEYNIRFSKKFN